MKNSLIAVLGALMLAAQPAAAQGFDVPIPGAGQVSTRVGFSPGFQRGGGPCGPLGQFPGNVTPPFFVYAILTRSVTAATPVTLRREDRWILPNSRKVSDFAEVHWPTTELCYSREYNRIDDFGEHRFQFFYNGVEVGRLTLNVTSR